MNGDRKGPRQPAPVREGVACWRLGGGPLSNSVCPAACRDLHYLPGSDAQTPARRTQILWGHADRKDDDQETNQAKSDRAPGLLEMAKGLRMPPAGSFLPFPMRCLLFGLRSYPTASLSTQRGAQALPIVTSEVEGRPRRGSWCSGFSQMPWGRWAWPSPDSQPSQVRAPVTAGSSLVSVFRASLGRLNLTCYQLERPEGLHGD